MATVNELTTAMETTWGEAKTAAQAGEWRTVCFRLIRMQRIISRLILKAAKNEESNLGQAVSDLDDREQTAITRILAGDFPDVRKYDEHADMTGLEDNA